MFGVIEDEHVTWGCLGGDDALILWHVASSVYLALVVYAYLDLDLAAHRAEAAELGTLTVVMRRVELGLIVRQLHARYHQVILLVGGVCAEDETMDCIVLAFWS